MLIALAPKIWVLRAMVWCFIRTLHVSLDIPSHLRIALLFLTSVVRKGPFIWVRTKLPVLVLFEENSIPFIGIGGEFFWNSFLFHILLDQLLLAISDHFPVGWNWLSNFCSDPRMEGLVVQWKDWLYQLINRSYLVAPDLLKCYLAFFLCEFVVAPDLLKCYKFLDHVLVCSIRDLLTVL